MIKALALRVDLQVSKGMMEPRTDFLHFNVLVTQTSARDLERDGTTLLTVKTTPRSELDLSPKIDQ
jgi:hypothetical protein